MLLHRRHVVAGLGALATAAVLPGRIAFAQGTGKKRLVFIIQRGAADGLGTLIPLGDPALSASRGALIANIDPIKIDASFGLHPALANTAKLYQAGEASFVHAVASNYRDRSHFDAQNVLETGGTGPYAQKDGWLNRLLDLLPNDDARALSLAPTVMPALRGSHAVTSYAPSALPDASADLIARVGALYQGDAALHAMFDDAVETRAATGDIAAGNGRNAAMLGEVAARLMTGAESARVVMLETGGWDTHNAQAGRLNAQLRGLDGLLGALKTGLGPVWNDTLVIVATEFGRTVAANGTGGTDHGTASAAMLLGGAVKGGRIIADWPGLRQTDLYEGRDLKPTLGLEALIASAVASHYGLDTDKVSRTLYPSHGRLTAVDGLIG